MLQVKLPDGSVKDYSKPTRVLDVANDIGPRLAKATLAGVVDGKVVGVDTELPDGADTGDMLSLLLQTFTIMGRSINQFEMRDADIALRPRLRGVTSVDFAARSQSIEAGREAALAALPQLKARIAALMH